MKTSTFHRWIVIIDTRHYNINAMHIVEVWC
jgi:hypothetical protein